MKRQLSIWFSLLFLLLLFNFQSIQISAQTAQEGTQGTSYFYPIDVDKNGNSQANDINGSSYVRMSHNGRWVVWVTASGLHPSLNLPGTTVMLKDMTKIDDPAIPITVHAADNTPVVGFFTKPDVSNDGQVFAFVAGLSEYGDKLAAQGVVLDHGTAKVISKTMNGEQLPSPVQYIVLSGNGRYAAYITAAKLVSDTNSVNDVYVYDLLENTNKLVSKGLNGYASGAGLGIDIDDNGTVVFTSAHLTNNDNPTGNGVYTYDLTTDQVKYALPLTQTVPSQLAAVENDVSISPNGRFIGFVSANSAFGNTGGYQQAFVYDQGFGFLKMLSKTSNGDPGNGKSHLPRIADNQDATFYTEAPNLGADSLLLYNYQTNTTTILVNHRQSVGNIGSFDLNSNIRLILNDTSSVFTNFSPDYKQFLPTPGRIFAMQDKPVTYGESGFRFQYNAWNSKNPDYQGQYVDWNQFESIWGKDKVNWPFSIHKPAAQKFFDLIGCMGDYAKDPSCKPIGYGGICGGMSMGAEMLYTGNMDLSNGTTFASDEFNEFTGNRGPISDKLFRLQLLQTSAEYKQEDEKSSKEDLLTTINKIMEVVDSGLNLKYIIALRLRNPADEKCGYHAVVPDAYADLGSKFIIRVYDPNHPAAPYDPVIPLTPKPSLGPRYIVVNKPTMMWIYDTGISYGVQKSGQICLNDDGKFLPTTIWAQDFSFINGPLTPPWEKKLLNIFFNGFTVNGDIQAVPNIGISRDHTETITSNYFEVNGPLTATITGNGSITLFGNGASASITTSGVATETVQATSALSFTLTTSGGNQTVEIGTAALSAKYSGPLAGIFTATNGIATIDPSAKQSLAGSFTSITSTTTIAGTISMTIGSLYQVVPQAGVVFIKQDIGKDGTVDKVITLGGTPRPSATPDPTTTATPNGKIYLPAVAK